MQNDKIKEYWEGEAGIYSEGIKAELKSETAENWKNLILEYAPEKEHLEVLDVGCGPGFFEIMLGKEGHHVTGIDITENMIHEAKENVKAAVDKPRCVAYNRGGQSLPLTNMRYKNGWVVSFTADRYAV